MGVKVRSIDRRLFTRRCVQCGYDGALLQGGKATRCARCACDLRKRPARSYAEMEGLTEAHTSAHRSRPEPSFDREDRVIQRWLFLLFLSMVGLISIAYLSAAMLRV